MVKCSRIRVITSFSEVPYSSQVYIAITELQAELRALVDDHPQWRKNAIANLAVLLFPFLPFSSEKVCKWEKQSVSAGYLLPEVDI
ncbi:MAG: hypothetical protein K2K63_10285 [Acetatifactor sp.]|nr:hypothetical protein [Acetatifactor sp.]